jgi:hypothetical protein
MAQRNAQQIKRAMNAYRQALTLDAQRNGKPMGWQSIVRVAPTKDGANPDAANCGCGCS